jgi:hypothetical protein
VTAVRSAEPLPNIDAIASLSAIAAAGQLPLPQPVTTMLESTAGRLDSALDSHPPNSDGLGEATDMKI